MQLAIVEKISLDRGFLIGGGSGPPFAVKDPDLHLALEHGFGKPP